MNLSTLPEDLPIPEDDGAADHLKDFHLPEISLSATNGEIIKLHKITGLLVFYVYPMTGRPDTPLPDSWDEIPGARGCTPQSCRFRDHYSELQNLNTEVFGISTQETSYQLEAKERLHLPFELLSDDNLLLKEILNLPTFKVDSMELYKRITLIVKDGIICKVFYPVFPPDKNSNDVIQWIKNNS